MRPTAQTTDRSAVTSGRQRLERAERVVVDEPDHQRARAGRAITVRSVMRASPALSATVPPK